MGSCELGAWPSGKNTLVMTISPVDRVCVSASAMTGRGGGGAGERATGGMGGDCMREWWVAAARTDSSLSILSTRSREELARISSTICIDSARETGPLPGFRGEEAAGEPRGRGEREDSGEAGENCSLSLDLKLSILGKSPGSQS